ncbi:MULTISPECIES: GNAT family N-acetyltransferase [unclassified Paenibacillus]|uniref:GNAT family N-acetyltransferase n=1 Tax=unclassified Paenibacillus TaxID=185978 RepID=UPI001AE648E5|nr:MULTISPECIES: GNAT family N-acetyltransferase [unclassified Paenibacillus]MBP1157116.1 ribosomal protein S18 acetylase RimI-like enzyme [Paenibacillus sp. PvP091]MBP1172145.1 ribosomal protein S18 acetylase RimI-like enzyme [Paenibacillus sp. PvR098]MBP2438526.1 ribosomal protein S18 acetylase RimI-like enzyme [Paenibacillus sp. PvP052]
MIRAIDLADMQEVLAFLLLQQTAYRVEAERIGFDEIPPLFDSPQSLRDSGESFFGYYEGSKLHGAAACKQSPKEVVICRMMVHPDCFRRGIASKLLKHLEQFALPGMKMIVYTGTNNTPAVGLYDKHGYEPFHMQLLAPGITLTQFQKML